MFFALRFYFYPSPLFVMIVLLSYDVIIFCVVWIMSSHIVDDIMFSVMTSYITHIVDDITYFSTMMSSISLSMTSYNWICDVNRFVTSHIHLRDVITYMTYCWRHSNHCVMSSLPSVELTMWRQHVCMMSWYPMCDVINNMWWHHVTEYVMSSYITWSLFAFTM